MSEFLIIARRRWHRIPWLAVSLVVGLLVGFGALLLVIVNRLFVDIRTGCCMRGSGFLALLRYRRYRLKWPVIYLPAALVQLVQAIRGSVGDDCKCLPTRLIDTVEHADNRLGRDRLQRAIVDASTWEAWRRVGRKNRNCRYWSYWASPIQFISRCSIPPQHPPQ